MYRAQWQNARNGGFTLVELVMVMTMMGILATIAIPKLDGLRDEARVAEAAADLKMLEAELVAAAAANTSLLPQSLADIGRDGFEDPWGNPYVYVPFSTALTVGCKAVLGGPPGGGGPGGGGPGGGGPPGGGPGGGSTPFATCTVTPPSGARKDRFLVPVNSDFDLYSMGADGVTAAPFTADPAQDDVVRAGNGGYFGLAEKF